MVDSNSLVCNDGKTAHALRVTFLAVMPTPYMMDLFDAIHRDPRIRLRVSFLERPAMAAPGVYWQEKSLPSYASVLPGSWFYFIRARVHVNAGLVAALQKDRPDVVVVLGYSSITFQLAMYGLWGLRIPWIFWGEIPGFERRGLLGRLLRWLAMRPVAHLARGVAAIGSRAADAYAQLSEQPRPVWNIPYYCANDVLLNISREQEPGGATAHFLYCGQMVLRKGVDLLVQAFCRLAREYTSVQLTLIGDGPLRAILAATVPETIRPRVHWVGFKEADELPVYFRQANIFVLPSLHDGWGVVINQAISAGMAVIASDAVGAAADLVENHVNGIVFPSKSDSALTAAMCYFADHPDQIHRFGAASRIRARELSPANGAERWFQFCASVFKRRK